MENANYMNIMNSSMNLMRRLPPRDTLKNLGAICELIKDDQIRDDVLVKTDQPIGKYYFTNY